MDIQATKRAIRIKEWATQINECIQSKQPVSIWCRENGINVKTYYNRLKRVREEMLTMTPPTQPDPPVFAALTIPYSSSKAITIHIGDHVAEIHNGADTSVIEDVLSVLSRL